MVEYYKCNLSYEYQNSKVENVSIYLETHEP